MRHAHVCCIFSVCISVVVCSTIRNTPDTTSNAVQDETTWVSSTRADVDETTFRPRADVTVLPKEDVTVLPKDVTVLPKEDVTVSPKEDVTVLPKEDVTVLPKEGVTVLPEDGIVLPKRNDVTVSPTDATVPPTDVTVLPTDDTVLEKDDVTTDVPRGVHVPVLLGRSLEIETNELDHNAVDNNGAVLICPDPEFIGKEPSDHKDVDPSGDAVTTVAHRPCRRDRDCLSVGEQCCPDRRGYHRCTLGVPPPQPEAPRSAFLGLLSRECPSSASSLIEPWPVINCTKDEDCWPRLCCRDAPGAPAFCRSPRPLWERMATPGLRSMLAYVQCTPPPPPVFDLFPKPCRSTFDCFPNLCCQERGRKVCRPPKRSLLALIASVGQVIEQLISESNTEEPE